MKSKLIFLGIFFGIISLLFLPYALYFGLLYNFNFISGLKVLDKDVADFKQEIRSLEVDDSVESLPWEMFHISHFNFPLLKDNPVMQFIPFSKKEDGKYLLGGAYTDLNDRQHLHFLIKQDALFDRSLQKVGLFKIPFIYNFLLGYKEDKIFEDIFNLKIYFLKDLRDTSIIDFFKVPYKQLFYMLYVNYLRSIYLVQESYDGLWSVDTPDGKKNIFFKKHTRFNELSVRFLKKGYILNFVINYERNDLAESMANKIIKEIDLRESYPGRGQEIYDTFKMIKRFARKNQYTVLTLFSILSHDLNNLEIYVEFFSIIKQHHGRLALIQALYDLGENIFGAEVFFNYLEEQQKKRDALLNEKLNEKQDETKPKEKVEAGPKDEAQLNRLEVD